MKVRPLKGLSVLRLSDGVTERVRSEPVTLRLRRAWPDRGGGLTLEYLAEGGTVVGARAVGGHRRERMEKEAGRLGRGGPAAVCVVPEMDVLIQWHGADRKLPALAPLLEEPTAALISHRPERRAVVRRGDGDESCFVKVVAPSKVSALSRAGRIGESAPVRTPTLIGSDRRRGLTVWSALPGRPLGERVHLAAFEHGSRVGKAMRRLHDHVPRHELPSHGPVDEMGVVLRWLRRLAPFADVGPLFEIVPRLEDCLVGPPSPARLIHRDLHDGQILMDDSCGIGLLDVDTLSFGEAALDLANLIVHLELGVHLGRWPQQTANGFTEGLLAGYGPSPGVLRRLVPYAAAARLRLSCVYAFRPGPDPTERLLDDIWAPPAGVEEAPALAGRRRQ